MKTELILYTQQLIENPKFSLIVDYGWGFTTGLWQKNEGSIRKISGTGDVLYQLDLLTNGVEYRLKFNITGRTTGSLTFKTNTAVLGTFNTNGNHSLDFTADGIDVLFTASSTFNGTISNVTIQALPLSYSLDLVDDVAIPLTFNIENIFNIATRKTAFSRTITLKGTHNNNIAFNQIYKINSDSLFNPNLISRCVIKNDGIKLLEGTLCLDNVTKKLQHDGIEDIEYSVSITGPVADIYTKLGTKTIRDLDFSDYNHDYTIGEIQGSWFGVNEIAGVPGSINRASTSTFTVASQASVNIGGIERIELTFTTPHDFQPGDEVYVQPNDAQCLVTGGANYLFDQVVLSVPSSTKIVLNCYSPTGPYAASTPSNVQQVSHDYFYGYGYYYPTVNYGTYMKVHYGQPLGTGLLEVGTKYIIKTYSSGDDFTNVGGVTNTQGEIFTATGSTPNSWAGSVLLTYRDIFIPLGEDTLISKWFNDPQEGCDSQWEVYDYIPHIFVREILLKMFKTTDYEYDCPSLFDTKLFRRLVIPINQTMQVKEGSRVIMNDWLPAIKLTDFLNSILNMFNLAMTVEDRLLTFVNRGEFFDNPSIDWSDKIDISQPLTLNMMNTNQPKSYQFKYKKSNDYYNLLHDAEFGNIANTHNLINRVDRNYGDYYTEIRSDYLTKNNKVELCFEPSILTSIDAFGGPNSGLFGDSRIVMSTSYVSSLDRTNLTRKEIPKILIAGVRWIFVNSSGSAFPHNFHLTSPLVPGSNLVDSYYYGYGGHIDNHFQQTPTHDLNWYSPLGYYFDKFDPNSPFPASPSVPSDLRLASWPLNSLFPKYWQRYLEHLTDTKAKTVTGFFKLDMLDIYNLDFSRPVKVGDLTMKLSKVIDWNAIGSGVCKCEFLVNK